MKKCSRCRQEKQLDEFNRNKMHSQGRSNYCRSCSKDYSKNWTTPEKLQEKYKARKLPERARAHKSNIMFKKYGITIEQYEVIWEQQGSCCAICKTLQNSKGKSFAVDHCHKTGKVRGILCDNCNQMLGKVKDSCKVLESAINYLQSA